VRNPVGVVGIGDGGDTTQKCELGSSEEGTAVGKNERVTDRPPQNRDQACDTKALCQNREDILLANEATVKKSETGQGHE